MHRLILIQPRDFRYFSGFLRQRLHAYGCIICFMAIKNLPAINIFSPILKLFMFLSSDLGVNEFYNLIMFI